MTLYELLARKYGYGAELIKARDKDSLDFQLHYSLEEELIEWVKNSELWANHIRVWSENYSGSRCVRIRFDGEDIGFLHIYHSDGRIKGDNYYKVYAKNYSIYNGEKDIDILFADMIKSTAEKTKESIKKELNKIENFENFLLTIK